jgi:hypothetical protein
LNDKDFQQPRRAIARFIGFLKRARGGSIVCDDAAGRDIKLEVHYNDVSR